MAGVRRRPASRPPAAPPPPDRPRISSSAASRSRARIGCGSPTSPTSRRGRASCTSPSSSQRHVPIHQVRHGPGACPAPATRSATATPHPRPLAPVPVALEQRGQDGMPDGQAQISAVPLQRPEILPGSRVRPRGEPGLDSAATFSTITSTCGSKVHRGLLPRAPLGASWAEPPMSSSRHPSESAPPRPAGRPQSWRAPVRRGFLLFHVPLEYRLRIRHGGAPIHTAS